MKKNFYFKKDILVAGGSGLIGRQLVPKLINLGAKVTVVSLDNYKSSKNLKFIKSDLRNFENCLKITKGKDIVFNLAGVKGSPKMTKEMPASFFVPTIMFSINLMEAARRNNVNNFLFTSSIGVYAPKKVFYEDDVWKTFPSENDKFAGWAKRISELQSLAYEIQYNWKNISIVRPANVYGPYDNFDINNAMVIPSLIVKSLNAKKSLKVWGDGSAIRDFVHSSDVADGMLIAVKKGIKEPLNLGSGKRTSIKQIVKMINKYIPNRPLDIIWDKTKPSGDKVRLMNIDRAASYGYKPKIDIETGIKNTIDWVLLNKKELKRKRYNSFLEKN